MITAGKRALAYFLLSVFFVCAAPKELVHELFCHHAVSAPVTSDALSIQTAPINCILLQQHFVSFTCMPALLVESPGPGYRVNAVLAPDDPVVLSSPQQLSLRGPPGCNAAC